MEALAILCAGGHGQDIAEIAEACGWQPHPYDDDPSKQWEPLRRFRLCDPYVVGVNNPSARRRIAVGPNAATLVHPSCTVASTAALGDGVVVGAGTQIGPHTELGPHVHVGAACTITRTKVGAFTTIAPGVDIAGDVTIGEECLIGVGAVISNLVTIGDRCTIGAGAVVIHDVPDDTTVAGVPARPIRQHTEEAQCT